MTVRKGSGFGRALAAWALVFATFHLVAEAVFSQQVKDYRFCEGTYSLQPHDEYEQKPGERIDWDKEIFHCKLKLRVPEAGKWVKHDIIFVPDDPAFEFNAADFKCEKSEKHGLLPEDAGWIKNNRDNLDANLEKRYGGFHLYRRYEVLGMNIEEGYRTGVQFRNRRQHGLYILLVRNSVGGELLDYRMKVGPQGAFGLPAADPAPEPQPAPGGDPAPEPDPDGEAAD